MGTHCTKHVGLDVHATTIAAAVAQTEDDREVRDVGQFRHETNALRKLTRALGAGAVSLHFWYEAGPCGYGHYRYLAKRGFACTVVAPTLTPRKAGDRVKTQRQARQRSGNVGLDRRCRYVLRLVVIDHVD